MNGHPLLNSITTSTTYDASVLEFDFVPETDTIRFKYVFGSDQYSEWVSSTFNDVFGAFIAGLILLVVTSPILILPPVKFP
ncbi:MAG: choice-of-anchor L domain-containing protein [Bacteroidales bacterium]